MEFGTTIMNSGACFPLFSVAPMFGLRLFEVFGYRPNIKDFNQLITMSAEHVWL